MTTPPQLTVSLTPKALLDKYQKEMVDLGGSVKVRGLVAKDEIHRLLNQKFYNPYDVMLLDYNATDDDINKQYRAFSILLHPDKCKVEGAKEAWGIVQQAHKTIIDPDKRRVYQRIIKEARDRTEFERDRENKKRAKEGQKPLPQETFYSQFKQNCLTIFKEIENKKNHFVKMQQSNHLKKLDELETKKMVEQYRILTEDEWQRSREKRVSNWREFSKKKSVIGTKRSDGGIRPPTVTAQTRPDYIPVQQKKKNL